MSQSTSLIPTRNDFFELFKYLETQPDSEEQVSNLFDNITSTKQGQYWLTNLLVPFHDVKASLPSPDVEKRALGGFPNKTSANASFSGFLFYMGVAVQLTDPKFNRGGSGRCGGLWALWPTSVSTGDVYYDDENDLHGDWNIQVTLTPIYANINWIVNGKTVATFQGMALGTTGVGGGTFHWT